MDKNLLLTACLIFVAIIGFGCVSAADADNNTLSEEPIHTVEQQNTNMMDNISTEKAIEENVNVENNNQQATDNTNLSKLNITGQKINGSKLDIKGPKINGKDPKICISQRSKDIYHFAKVFMNNPHWDLYDCIDYIRFHSSYKWHEISSIVAEAHNIALHKYQGKEIMCLGWEITPESVEYRSKNYYGWK